MKAAQRPHLHQIQQLGTRIDVLDVSTDLGVTKIYIYFLVDSILDIAVVTVVADVTIDVSATNRQRVRVEFLQKIFPVRLSPRTAVETALASEKRHVMTY